MKKMTDIGLVKEKRCSRCGHIKPRAEFSPNHYAPTGLAYECKPCKAASQRASYAKKNEGKPLRQRPRRPLPDVAKDAAWSLRKDVERLARVLDDDRFPTHKHQVAMHARGHLEYAAEVCQDLLSRLNNPQGA